jgi:transcriptional regulator of acetoin/glycerol metabolism
MPYDHKHEAAAATKRLAEETAALERAAREVAQLEARLASARGAQQDTLVRCVRELHWPVSLAASAAGVSRETAHKWLRS